MKLVLLKILICECFANLASGYPLQFQQGAYNGVNLLSGFQSLLPQYQMLGLANTIPYYTGGGLANIGTGNLVKTEFPITVPAGSLVMLPTTRDSSLPVTSLPTTGSLPTGSVIPGTGALPGASPVTSCACLLAGTLGNVLQNSLCCGAMSLPCQGLLGNGLIGGVSPGLGQLETLLTAYSLLQSLGGLGGLRGGCLCNPLLPIPQPPCCLSVVPTAPVAEPIPGNTPAGALPNSASPNTGPVSGGDGASSGVPLPAGNDVNSAVGQIIRA